jgi:hypothetical protein
MKQKFQAGSLLDILTKDELEGTMHGVLKRGMQAWYAEACIGTRFRRFAVQGNIAANALDMGGEKGEQIGPDDGFAWNVKRLHISGLNVADVVSIGVNDRSAATLITTSADVTGGRTWFFNTQLVLQPGESLKIYGSSLNASTGVVTVSGQVQELPVTQLWRLGGN